MPDAEKSETFKQFCLWLAALFLIALGAQLQVVSLYGSPVPFWDQWYEADSLFKPWMHGHLSWNNLFAADSDHRILLTHLLDIGLISLNGRWDPLLQMTVNAFFHAVFACGLAFCLWQCLGRKNGWLVCFLLSPFFALPYAGENAIWGINSLWYFVNIFALVTVTGMGFGRTGSWPWWTGLAAGILSLFTMASGLLAPVAAGGLIVLRAVKNRRMEKDSRISLGVCVLLTLAGLAMSVTANYNQPLKAQSVGQFLSALVRNLAWPFFQSPEMACVIALPLVLLLVVYLRPNFPSARVAELLLALAFWSALQSAVIAYGRANYSEDVPASRYMDVFNVFVMAALFATVLLGQFWQRPHFPRWHGMVLPLVFAAVMFFGLYRVSQVVVEHLLAPTRRLNLIAEERIQTFMASGNEQDLFEKPTVRPDPKLTLSVLNDAALRPILPRACFPPAKAPAAGRLARGADWLVQYSIAILFCGLILFAGLCGFGLARGAPGLTMRNPLGIVALLAGLAAIGFVWSNRSLQRETVESTMEQELADYFKSFGNLKRAAIYERKAEELKQGKSLTD